MQIHRRKYKLCVIILLLTLLTGCWDQRLLKDLKLVFTIAFDLGENEEVISHVAIRETKKLSIGGKPGEATEVVVEGDGMTLRDTRLNLDRRIPGYFSPSKMRAYLLGEELAKTDIYSLLDILYRDPKAPLGAKLAIVQGKAEDVIKMQTIKETLLTETITDLLVSNEEYTLIKNESVQTVCPVMFDPSSDFSLPVIREAKSRDIEVVGMGLISDRKYTGVVLSPQHSTILLLMGNNKKRIAQFTMIVNPDEENIRNKYMVLDIKKAKSKIKTIVDSPSDIKVHIDLELTGSIAEYAKDHVVNKKVVKKLEKKAAAHIQSEAQKTIETLQSANSDILKIGQKIRVHHHQTWKEISWREVYPTIEIIPTVKVKIIGTGIIN